MTDEEGVVVTALILIMMMMTLMRITPSSGIKKVLQKQLAIE